MNHLLKSIFVTGIIFLHITCHTQRHRTGGSCGYNHKKYPATIILVGKYDSIRYLVAFEVIRDARVDTFYFTDVYSRPAKQEDIDKYDLRLGNRFTYDVMDITSGACTPHIERLTLEPYKED